MVEDNEQNALLARRILEARHHQVIHANDGESGLQAAIDEIPDIILVDLGLPDIDGQTLVAFFKRTPELADIPIVAVTAWPEDTAREMAEAYGCDGFISKPINTRAFPDQVAKFIKTD
ncbi:MAG: response regulator [Anaerolineae bacterium]|nr:response regulator [Anaerolineae bacterium]